MKGNRISTLTFVMKFVIAVLILVGTAPLPETNAELLENFERFWTASPENSVLFTPNQSEPSQLIEFKKLIDYDHPLILTAEVSNTGNGDILYKGSDLNICKDYDTDTWDYVAVRIFNRGLIPGPRRSKCPVEPQVYEIYRYQNNLRVTVGKPIPYGKYEIFYTATSDTGQLVFSTLKFRFSHIEAYSYW